MGVKLRATPNAVDRKTSQKKWLVRELRNRTEESGLRSSAASKDDAMPSLMPTPAKCAMPTMRKMTPDSTIRSWKEGMRAMLCW